MTNPLLETHARLLRNFRRQLRQASYCGLISGPSVTALHEVTDDLRRVLAACSRAARRWAIKEHAMVLFRIFAVAAVSGAFEHNFLDSRMQTAFALQRGCLRDDLEAK